MAALVGVELPSEEGARLALTAESTAFIMLQVSAGIAGAADTVRLLAKDYVMYTASGGASHELRYTLTGMGLVEEFRRLYGPDLINTPKGDPRFYRRLFADADVEPSESLVLDDKVENLVAARAAGAQVVLVGRATAPEGMHHIWALAALPMLLHDPEGLG
jgi:FMN phosphatase YigB (HAD superfamily)